MDRISLISAILGNLIGIAAIAVTILIKRSDDRHMCRTTDRVSGDMAPNICKKENDVETKAVHPKPNRNSLNERRDKAIRTSGLVLLLFSWFKLAFTIFSPVGDEPLTTGNMASIGMSLISAYIGFRVYLGDL